MQHGFTEDNFKELLFAVHQLLREDEEANERYARIVRQILREFMEKVGTNQREVDREVRKEGEVLALFNALSAACCWV